MGFFPQSGLNTAAFVRLSLFSCTFIAAVERLSIFSCTFTDAVILLQSWCCLSLVSSICILDFTAGVKADVERNSLILETGVNQRWRYGGWRPSPDSIGAAEEWEEAKAGLEGLHFLAVQPDPDSEELNGLWLLLDKMPPNV